MLTPHAPNLWSATCDHGFMGLQFGARMTVIGFGDDTNRSLVLHSPIKLTDALAAAIADLGQVVAVIAPNLFHHVFVSDALKRFPDAKLVAPAALAKKRGDLKIDVPLSDLHHLDDASPSKGPADEATVANEAPWDLDRLVPVAVEGQSTMRETVFLHRESRSLITTDLVLNIEQPQGTMTRFYAWASKYKGEPIHSPLLKMTTWNDKAAAKSSLKRIIALDFDRLVLAHGTVVDTQGQAALANAFAWLLNR